MIPNISLVVIVGHFILANIHKCQCEQNLNFGSFIKTTCPDNVTTKWNKISIGTTLKTWIDSINEITPVIGKEHYFRKKAVSMFEDKWKKDGITYIANMDCTRNQTFGPTWRKPSTFSSTQFQDGFLYGIEDINGELTGS